jgi:hypothetical protein
MPLSSGDGRGHCPEGRKSQALRLGEKPPPSGGEHVTPLENHHLRGPSHAILELARNSDLWHPGPSTGSKRQRAFLNADSLAIGHSVLVFLTYRIKRTTLRDCPRPRTAARDACLDAASSLASSAPATQHGLLSKRSLLRASMFQIQHNKP